MLKNEGNQIHNFISSSGSETVINYGSGSDFEVTVPVPLVKKLGYGSYSSGSGSTTLLVSQSHTAHL